MITALTLIEHVVCVMPDPVLSTFRVVFSRALWGGGTIRGKLRHPEVHDLSGELVRWQDQTPSTLLAPQLPPPPSHLPFIICTLVSSPSKHHFRALECSVGGWPSSLPPRKDMFTLGLGLDSQRAGRTHLFLSDHG